MLGYQVNPISFGGGGGCFLSDTLLSICHDVVAFTGIATFPGLLISFGASLSVLQLISLVCSLVELSLSVVFDEMSMNEGGLSSSNYMATAGVFVFPCFWGFPFLGADCSGSLELEVSLIVARFLSTSFVPLTCLQYLFWRRFLVVLPFQGVSQLYVAFLVIPSPSSLRKLVPIWSPLFFHEPVSPRVYPHGNLRAGIPVANLELKIPKVSRYIGLYGIWPPPHMLLKRRFSVLFLTYSQGV